MASVFNDPTCRFNDPTAPVWKLQTANVAAREYNGKLLQATKVATGTLQSDVNAEDPEVLQALVMAQRAAEAALHSRTGVRACTKLKHQRSIVNRFTFHFVNRFVTCLVRSTCHQRASGSLLNRFKTTIPSFEPVQNGL